MNCVNTGSGNGLSPVRRQAITWTNADLSSIRPLGTSSNEICIMTRKFALKIEGSALEKCLSFCPGAMGKHIEQNDRRQIRMYSLEIIFVFFHSTFTEFSLLWRHNERDGVSNHQPRDCLPNRLFRCRSTKTLKLRVTGLCEGNSSVTGEFSARRASNAEMFPFDGFIMCSQGYNWR